MSDATPTLVTRCPQGHSMHDPIIEKRGDRDGIRMRCRVCRREREAKRSRARKPETEGVCALCGDHFLGRSNRKYCDTCRTSNPYNTHCRHGHSMHDAYVEKRSDREGFKRRCRVCVNARSRERERLRRRDSEPFKTPPTEATCVKCGEVFAGRKGRKFCDDCKRRSSNIQNGRAWDKLRKQVQAEEPDCWICGEHIDPDLKHPHPMSFQGDHVIPRSEGGAVLDRSNVRASHARCNNLRSRTVPAEMRAELSRLRAEVAALRAALNLR